MCEASRYPPAIHVWQLATTPGLSQWLVWRPAEMANWIEHMWAPDSNFRLTPTFDSVAGLNGRSSRSVTVNWKVRRILEPRKRLAQNHAVYCFRLRAAVQRAWIGFSKMWHNMCLLLSASFRSRSLWTRYLRQTLSWLPGGSGLVTVRPRCWRVTRGKWSGVLPRYFLDKRWLYMMCFQQLNWQHIDQQQKASSHGLRLVKINPFNCGGQSNAPKSLRVGTAMYVIQQLLCRLATVLFWWFSFYDAPCSFCFCLHAAAPCGVCLEGYDPMTGRRTTCEELADHLCFCVLHPWPVEKIRTILSSSDTVTVDMFPTEMGSLFGDSTCGCPVVQLLIRILMHSACLCVPRVLMFLKQPFGQIGGSYCGVPDFTGAPHDGNTGPQVSWIYWSQRPSSFRFIFWAHNSIQSFLALSMKHWKHWCWGCHQKAFLAHRLWVSREMRAWAPAQTLESKLCFKLCLLWTALHGWMWGKSWTSVCALSDALVLFSGCTKTTRVGKVVFRPKTFRLTRYIDFMALSSTWAVGSQTRISIFKWFGWVSITWSSDAYLIHQLWVCAGTKATAVISLFIRRSLGASR